MMRSSIRMQLTAAMVGVAILATALSMLIANYSLHEHLTAMESHPNSAQSEPGALADELDRQHAIAGIAAVLFALAAALLLARKLTAPIDRLSVAAHRLASGDLASAIAADGPTEIGRLAVDFELLRTHLLTEDRLRRVGFSDLAHELRTPVTNIRARLEAADDGVIPIVDGLPVMRAEIERLSRLLDELSLLADLENPIREREQVSVDLGEIVSRQALLAEARLASKQLELRMELRPDTRILGEPERLEQVICNLLSNAIAYSDSGGSVTLSVSQDADRAMIEVSDDGIGIPAHELGLVTRRFWRGSTARSHARGGSGVGLAIADEIVRSHGGHIRIESREGVGTSVRVELPIGAKP
ncbi:MAG: ATP-binding protein [Gaiellales bacterium]